MSAPAEAAAYRGRYPFLAERRGVWREIVRVIRRDTPGADRVVELGAGYCDFINQYPASRRVAYDLNPEMQRFADPGVELRIENALELAGIAPGSLDLVFASNFFEHLSHEQLDVLLPKLHRALADDGLLALVQPNHTLCPDHYWDDDTHVTLFSDANVGELLAPHGFRVRRLVPRFLPFSMKSRLPKWPILTRLYLASPWRPLAGQMYVLAEKA